MHRCHAPPADGILVKELSASNNTSKESDYEITFASRKRRCHSCVEALRNDLDFQTDAA